MALLFKPTFCAPTRVDSLEYTQRVCPNVSTNIGFGRFVQQTHLKCCRDIETSKSRVPIMWQAKTHLRFASSPSQALRITPAKSDHVDHPGRWTGNLKMMSWKMMFFFNWGGFLSSSRWSSGVYSIWRRDPNVKQHLFQGPVKRCWRSNFLASGPTSVNMKPLVFSWKWYVYLQDFHWNCAYWKSTSRPSVLLLTCNEKASTCSSSSIICINRHHHHHDHDHNGHHHNITFFAYRFGSRTKNWDFDSATRG